MSSLTSKFRGAILPLRPAPRRRASDLPSHVRLRAVLELSPNLFVGIWGLLQAFHLLCGFYHLGVAMVHLYILDEQIDATITYLGANMFDYFDAVIVGHSLLTACHFVAICRALGWSIWYRTWAFGERRKTASKVHRRRPNATPEHPDGNAGDGPHKKSIASSHSASSVLGSVNRGGSGHRQTLLEWFRGVLLKVFGSNGLLGVEGTHYETAFFVVEVVEISMQIFQAYKLSHLVSKIWINRLNAVIISLNCWSTVIVHLSPTRDRLGKRIILLAVDMAFDVITSMAIPLAIFFPYYWQFQPSRRDFPLVLYYHDTWVIQAISENRQVFVTSWLDYISKLVPACTILCGLMVLKSYVAMGPPPQEQHDRRSCVDCLRGMIPHTRTRIRPDDRSSLSSRTASTMASWTADQLTTRVVLFAKKRHTWQHTALVACGLAVLAIHLHTATVALQGHVRGCLLEIRPWFSTTYTCVALEINCADGTHDHGRDRRSMNDLVRTIRPDGVQSLIFSSCAALSMPTALQTFSSLQMMKVYNSTIVTWDADAELTAAAHTDLQFLYFCDANFTNVELPRGMLGGDFPPRLQDIEFSGTNLRATSFPLDLNAVWGLMQFIIVERSPGITEFPLGLLNLRVPQLSLAMNAVNAIPDELFADQRFEMLILAENPVSRLPTVFGDVGRLYKLSIAFTLIGELPPWLREIQRHPKTDTPMIPFLGYADVFAGGSPLCDHFTDVEGALEPHFRLHCDVVGTRVYHSIYPHEDEKRWRSTSKERWL